jgi:threonine synthase
VYYVTSAMSLGGGMGGRPVSFTVPTGNFGNILAGWVALQMGIPVDQLVIGSNRNDILTRFLHSGLMHTTTVVPTLSPSMDIQVSSNFERLLYEMNDRDGGLTAEQMLRFRATGRLDVETDQMDRWIHGTFRAARVDDTETLEEIRRIHSATGRLIDPHTATATLAARRLGGDHPVVSLATAHPAKFPDAVMRATGVHPALPDHLDELLSLPERTTVLPNDLAAVESFVERVARPV